MGIDFFDKPYGSSNPVKRPYIHKRLDKHQSSFGSTARRTIAESYEADTFAGTSLYVAYALRVDSKPGQRVKVKAWCRKTHPSLKAFAPESYEDNVSIDKFPTYLAIKDSIPAPTPGEKIWVEYGNENLETPRYIGPVNDREHLTNLIKSTSGAGAFGAYPCGALNSSATNVGALGGTTAQGRNVPVSSTGLPQTNRKSSDLTGENVFMEATSAPALTPERASWRKNVAAAGCRESRNWIGKLSGNRNKSVVIHIPGTTDLNLPLETYVWIHGAGGNNPSGRTWEFLPRLSKKMGEAGRNFILIFPVVAPASRHHSGGAEGSIGILVNQSIEVIQTQLAPGTQIQIAYRTIGAHSAGGGIMARSALDPNGLMSYQPDKITLADITGIGGAFTKIWENYMQRVNKAVQLNVLGSGTTFGAQGKNGPKVEGQIQQFFAKVTPSSTTPSAAYSGDLTLQVQKSNGAIQHITRAKIQGLNHTTYAFAGYEYINPAAARKNSNKTTTTSPAHTDAGPAATILFDSTSRESLREPAVWNFPANGPLPPDWDIRNFGPQTLKSRGDNMVVMHKETLRALDKATTRAASFGHPPIRLTNQVKQGRNGAYRDPELNRREGGKPGSRHKFGNGFDIWTKDFTNEQRMALLGNLYNVGFRGFGHGPNNIHADTSRKRQWNYNNYPVPSWKEIEAGSAAGPGGGKNIGPNPLNPSTGPNPGATTCSTVSTLGAVERGGKQVAGNYPANSKGLFPAIKPVIRNDSSLAALYGPGPPDLVQIEFQGKRIRVNKLVKTAFEMVNAEINALKKTDPEVAAYKWFRSAPGGGTYNPRCKKNPTAKEYGVKPGDFPNCREAGASTHSWGITMDVNPADNPYKKPLVTDIPKAIVGTFKRYGFKWGGDWSTPDSMHFQFHGDPKTLGSI
jgi:hypothetical protein